MGGCIRSTDDGDNRVGDKILLVGLEVVHPFALADVEEEYGVAVLIAAGTTSTVGEHVSVTDGGADGLRSRSRVAGRIGGVAFELDPVERWDGERPDLVVGYGIQCALTPEGDYLMGGVVL